jgi:hypothetical protein
MGDDIHSKVEVFKTLVSSLKPSNGKQPLHRTFVKRMEAIPQLEHPSPKPRRKSLILDECALTGKFTGLWASLRADKYFRLLLAEVTLCFSFSIGGMQLDLSFWTLFHGIEGNVLISLVS